MDFENKLSDGLIWWTLCLGSIRYPKANATFQQAWSDWQKKPCYYLLYFPKPFVFHDLWVLLYIYLLLLLLFFNTILFIKLFFLMHISLLSLWLARIHGSIKNHGSIYYLVPHSVCLKYECHRRSNTRHICL